MLRQDLLEPDHNPGMVAIGIPVAPGTGGRQTGHQGLDQTLFNDAGDSEYDNVLGLVSARRHMRGESLENIVLQT
jgi:hypothetical protein